ncbi:MAG: substrate-binding domain-containing protein [Planctomycetota bacterium]|nr:MAG: substrate-binding domain-containing protein [Planctomycetota bacterium]
MLVLSGCEKSNPDAAKKKRIAVIPKGLTHDHWKSVEAGAKKAAEEDGTIDIDWKGPPKEDDTRQQIDLVQNFVSGGIDGIILAPLSDQALLSPVKLAVSAGIPVVIIDSALAGECGKDFVNYVGTDNYTAGTLAGKRMAELVEGKGTVLLLRYAESSASTRKREQGFLDTLKKTAPEVKVIDPPQYAGADVNSAKKASENMLIAYEGKFEAIFCPNESSTFGMMLAMEDRQLTGKVKFVGFDVRPEFIQALKDGKLHGFVVQNPFMMGYLSVKSILAHMKGEKVQESIDTGAVLVTKESLGDSKVQKVLYPRRKE